MEQGFYNLNHGDPADRYLPIMVQHITYLWDQTRASKSRILEVRVAVEITVTQSRQPERDYRQTCSIIDDLQEGLTTA